MLLHRHVLLYLPTLGACQRVSGSRGAPAVPHHFGRVGCWARGEPVALTLTALPPQLFRV